VGRDLVYLCPLPAPPADAPATALHTAVGLPPFLVVAGEGEGEGTAQASPVARLDGPDEQPPGHRLIGSGRTVKSGQVPAPPQSATCSRHVPRLRGS
jgi:hypothetical protein